MATHRRLGEEGLGAMMSHGRVELGQCSAEQGRWRGRLGRRRDADASAVKVFSGSYATVSCLFCVLGVGSSLGMAMAAGFDRCDLLLDSSFSPPSALPLCSSSPCSLQRQ